MSNTNAVTNTQDPYSGATIAGLMPSFNTPTLLGVDARDGTKTSRPLSELGNAARLTDKYSGDIYYVHLANAWLIWRNGAWSWNVGGAEVRRLATLLPDQIYSEGRLYLNDAFLFAKWARLSQKETTIKATVLLLKDVDIVQLSLSSVDADLFKAGINNSKHVLDLKEGIVKPSRQSDLITKSLGVNSIGEASKAVRWLEFLNQVFENDVELIDWIKRFCGYMLTGSTEEHILIFCFGLGANGKSVFGEILRSILGDYARAIAPESLTESKRVAGGASPDLADLIGARLAISAETEDGTALAESLVKSLVSGDAMTVRQLYCPLVEFIPQFKLIILGNHKPIVKGNDHGIWRRVCLIPFNRIFRQEERDPKLITKLKDEAPHILAWMVEGCLDWQSRGLKDLPAVIVNATESYQEEQDLIGIWISECCDKSPSKETTAADIYTNYTEWCTANGLRSSSNITLGRRLGERGFKAIKTKGKRGWSGLSIIDPDYAEKYRAASGR